MLFMAFNKSFFCSKKIFLIYQEFCDYVVLIYLVGKLFKHDKIINMYALYLLTKVFFFH